MVYYKQNLYIYNFDYHDFNKNLDHMFVCPVTEGSRGFQEILSCVIKYIKSYAEDFEKIYSDSCTRQNRKTILSLLKFVQSTEIRAQSIEMKFLVNGHGYLPNNSDFAIIERYAKKIQYVLRTIILYKINS